VRRSPTIALPLATLALATLGVVTPAHASPWDDVAHPHRRRCAQLVDEANKLAETQQWKGATQAARAAAAFCPSDRFVVQSAGEILLNGHEPADARQQLEHARALADANPETRDRELSLAYALGVAREMTGDLDGAIDEHRRLESSGGLPSPNQYLVHKRLGDELMAVGRLAEAIDEYRRTVLLAPPTKPIVRLALAVALDRDEQIDQARTELVAVLALDPELRCLASADGAIIPGEDAYYYRAVALLERGATAEARAALRTFVAELPASPYLVHARRRLADAEQHVDARELEPAVAGVDRSVLARALGPVVGGLESCLPAQRVIRVRLQVAGGRLTTEAQHPAAECLDRVLSRVDASALTGVRMGSVVLPLAGRRGAASLP
jgi:tetratricopeptide (TPR) repeat protein